jgi:hypothetical protein
MGERQSEPTNGQGTGETSARMRGAGSGMVGQGVRLRREAHHQMRWTPTRAGAKALGLDRSPVRVETLASTWQSAI